MYRYSLYIFFLISWFSICLSQLKHDQASVLAKAGNLYITEKEFLERYELLPGQYRNRSGNVEESKLVFLYSLVAEKLLAQEAEMRHLDQDSMYQPAIGQVKKNLARDQLYREQISGKVKVSRKEVQRAIVDAGRQLFISYLYFEDSTEAEFVRKQLGNCKKFNQFQIDTTMAVIRDTTTLIWGEAEAPIEQAGFRLKKGECSSVIKASTGYYILHLEYESPNTFYISMQPKVLYERVETKLRFRKEKARLDEYLQSAFLTKTGFSLPKPFKFVAKVFTDVWKDRTPGQEEMVTDSLLEVVHARCQAILQDSIVIVGSSYWTVKDVLYKLRGKTFKIDSSRTTGIAVQLNFYLLVMVQQELLAEEGLSQKLDERSSVKDELDIWRQQILAKLAEMDFQKNIQVSDQDIMQYLEEFNSEARYPRVQIRELHTKDITSMDQSLMEVRAGVSFQEVIRKHSTDLRSAQNSGLSDEFPVNERMPLGMLCWRMQVGERTGPVHLQNDYIYFELVKKEYPTGESDSSFSSLMQKTANDASIFKKKKLLDIFIAKIAQQRGYAIYADRLKQLKVSNVPMMTYRILGFGGRMFAVPFVTRQVDWIGVENPDTIPLP